MLNGRRHLRRGSRRHWRGGDHLHLECYIAAYTWRIYLCDESIKVSLKVDFVLIRTILYKPSVPMRSHWKPMMFLSRVASHAIDMQHESQAPLPPLSSPSVAHMFCSPAADWLSLCIRATYCFDTVFHALMYFSMQFVKHVSSPLESDVPGFGTQRSKQCSLSFWQTLVQDICSVE